VYIIRENLVQEKILRMSKTLYLYLIVLLHKCIDFILGFLLFQNWIGGFFLNSSSSQNCQRYNTSREYEGIAFDSIKKIAFAYINDQLKTDKTGFYWFIFTKCSQNW